MKGNLYQHIFIRHAYDFSLCFPHELLMSFRITKRTFFTIFFPNVSDLVLCPRVTFSSIFYKRTMPYNKKRTDLTISNIGLAVLTSLSLGQYSKTSVGYFPVLPSLSVSKLLILSITESFR
jgi:hypothetical protein